MKLCLVVLEDLVLRCHFVDSSSYRVFVADLLITFTVGCWVCTHRCVVLM